MKAKSVKNNFIYQVLYNIVTMIVPLVVTPFLTRALREEQIGNFTYSRSVASYFVAFAMMGIAKYGQRVIAQNRDEHQKLRKTFWGLFYVHIFFSSLAVLFYLIVGVLFIHSENTLYWIQTIYVFSAVFDITWLYYGLENFGGVVLRNAVIKIAEALIYILCIKTPDDILFYAFVNCCVFLLSQIVLLPSAIKEIRPISVRLEDCKVHFKPMIVFAVAVIGISLYTIFDTTLLGIFSSSANVAFYDYSNKIAKIPLTIASIIGTVLFPRACRLAAQNNIAEQKKYMHYSMIIVSIVGSVSLWGLMAVGTPLAKLYLGDGFSSCGPIIASLAPLVYIIGIGDVVRTQVMIPNGMDKEYIFSILMNATINLILSTVLIRGTSTEYQVYGAVAGTVVAETVGMFYQLVLCRKFISIKKLSKTVLCTFAIGAIMYGILRIFITNISWNIVSFLEIIGIGVVIFIPLTLIYICIFEKDFRKLLFRR